jgi:hypothetical protein
MNQSMAENFIRSANAPQISAGVMIGEGHLEHHVDRLGNRERKMRHGELAGLVLVEHAVQEEAVEAPDHRPPGSEGDAVADHDPQHGDERR